MNAFEPVSTVEALTRALQQRIRDGEFAPGAFLREAQITSTYGVARHTARAAMHALVFKGVLRHTAGRGVQVPIMDAEDVIDLFRLRAALESEAVRLIVMSGAPPNAVALATAQFEALPENAPWSLVVEIDFTFHRGVVADAGSPRLTRAYDAAQSEIELCMTQLRPHYDQPSQVTIEHQELLKMLLQGDLEAANQAFRKHWDAATEQLLRSAAPSTNELPAGGVSSLSPLTEQSEATSK